MRYLKASAPEKVARRVDYININNFSYSNYARRATDSDLCWHVTIRGPGLQKLATDLRRTCEQIDHNIAVMVSANSDVSIPAVHQLYIQPI